MKLTYLGNPKDLTTKELIELRNRTDINSTSQSQLNLELNTRKIRDKLT